MIQQQKTKIGIQANSLLDDLDLKILNIKSIFTIMNVAKQLNISHKSLKPHIDKLYFVGALRIFNEFDKTFKVTAIGDRLRLYLQNIQQAKTKLIDFRKLKRK